MTVEIAVVGLGYWGPHLARNVARLPDDVARLHTLCDSSPDVLSRQGGLYPEATPRAEFGEVLADPQVDAVMIATPVSAHYQMAKAALEAGKHVMVEKPLARTSEECAELVRLADANGLVLMCGHVFVYNAAVRLLKDYIDSGELGDIYYAYSQRLNLGIVRRDVNALWNFAPHDISIFGYWFDAMPERVTANGHCYLTPDNEDVVFMNLDYPGGVGASAHISWLDPNKVRKMTVVGSKKMIVYDDVSTDAKLMVFDRGVAKKNADSSLGTYAGYADFQLLVRAGDIVIPKIDFVEPLGVECRHFAECITNGESPLTDGRAGLDVVRVLEAAQLALETRRPVDLESPRS